MSEQSQGRPTCKTCPYLLTYDRDDVSGHCMRNPPQLVHVGSTTGGVTAWPGVMTEDYCGEHPDFPAWMAAQRAAQAPPVVETVSPPVSPEFIAAADVEAASVVSAGGPVTWRTVVIEPIEDLHAICEMMDEFSIAHPENYAALEAAKAAAANRQVWTGEPIEPPDAAQSAREVAEAAPAIPPTPNSDLISAARENVINVARQVVNEWKTADVRFSTAQSLRRALANLDRREGNARKATGQGDAAS